MRHTLITCLLGTCLALPAFAQDTVLTMWTESATAPAIIPTITITIISSMSVKPA